jgi:hypothetical protein
MCEGRERDVGGGGVDQVNVHLNEGPLILEGAKARIPIRINERYEVCFGWLKGETGDSQQHRYNVFCFWCSHLFLVHLVLVDLSSMDRRR